MEVSSPGISSPSPSIVHSHGNRVGDGNEGIYKVHGLSLDTTAKVFACPTDSDRRLEETFFQDNLLFMVVNLFVST